MPSSGYIKSHSFFIHPKYTTFENPGDIGLIKLEHPFDRPERDETQFVANIICLPVRGFRLKKGTHIAKIAGSGPDLNRVKTGSTRVEQMGDHFNRDEMEFGSKTCRVRSLSPINKVQLIYFP